MNLINILNEFGKRHLKDLEEETSKSKSSKSGISFNEAWELNKLDDKPKEFTEFKKDFERNKTYNLDED